MSIISVGLIAAVIEFMVVSFILGNGTLKGIGEGFQAGIIVLISVVVIVFLLTTLLRDRIEFDAVEE